MMRAGLFTENDPIELLEGLLIWKARKSPAHTGAVLSLENRIEPALPAGLRYRAEQPIILPDGEPEPDGVVAVGTRADDHRFQPPAADVVLVIEVADATLDRDRGIKLRSYARAGIPAYWLVNLIDRQIEVYADPDPSATPHPTYGRRVVYAGTDAVPLSIGGVALPPVAVAAVLPPDAR